MRKAINYFDHALLLQCLHQLGICSTIIQWISSYLSDHVQMVKYSHFTATFNHLLPQLDCLQQHTVLHTKELNFLVWLSVLPLKKDQFGLSAQQFRDALAFCYCKLLLNLPGVCHGCGATFTVNHALDCRFGGLVTYRYNQV